MARFGFTLMVVIAAAVGLASCDTGASSLFADEPAASSTENSRQGTPTDS